MLTILITGASDGIGHVLAVGYASNGARVLGIGRRAFPSSLAGFVAREDYCAIDLERPDAVDGVRAFLLMRNVTCLNVVIHNAAVGWYGPCAEQSSASIDQLLRVNLHAPILLTHLLLPWLRASRGVVVFVSSVHSALPTPEFAVYTATKAGLDGFARNLRLEERGVVDVVTLWPGPTRTNLHASSGVPQERVRAGRYAEPERVAQEVMAAVDRRRSQAIGRANRLLRWVATHFEAPIDALMSARARHGGRK